MLINIKAKIKRCVLLLTGHVGHLKKGVECKYNWYGNYYGGFFINPDFLNKNSIVYSFGIGSDISFDEAIIEHHNCHVFGFDPTPKSINWIKEQRVSENFHFYPFGISSESGFIDFYLPKNPRHISGSIITQKNVDLKEKVLVEMKSLKDIINELGHSHIDILKMDIEGAEYEVIKNIINTKVSIDQICVEFHDRLFEKGHLQSKYACKLLRDNGYEIFAISDSYEEISFIHNRVFQ